MDDITSNRLKIEKLYKEIRIKSAIGEKFYIIIICDRDELSHILGLVPDNTDFMKWEVVPFGQLTKGYRWGPMRPNVLLTSHNVSNKKLDTYLIDYLFHVQTFIDHSDKNRKIIF